MTTGKKRCVRGRRFDHRFSVCFALALGLYLTGTRASASGDVPPGAPPLRAISLPDALQETLSAEGTGAWLRWVNGGVSVQGARYEATLAAELSQSVTIEYRYQNHRLGLRPAGPIWRLASGREIGLGDGIHRVEARHVTDSREVEGGFESPLREDGLIYRNAYGKGLHLGALARERVLRKIVRVDHLADLGEIPEHAELLELPFVVETGPGTRFAARFGGEAIRNWDRNQTVIVRGEAIEFGAGVHRSFLLPAHAWDSSGSRIPISLQLEAKGGEIYLTKRIPVGWLSRAAFPVFADVDLSFGTPSVFQSFGSSNTSVTTLDATHVVIAYQPPSAAVVGTISNNTITYGTAAQFDTSTTNFVSVTALDSTHVVVAFRDDGSSGFGTAVVGTISGDTITFGTSVVFESASTSRISVTTLDSTHVLIAYSDGGNSGFGTAIVGTISGGDTIAFGTPVVFESAFSANISATGMDSTHALIAYRDDGNGGSGTAIVGTISGGDTITFGTAAVFNAASTAEISAAALDGTHVAIGYQNRTTTADQGTAVVATISGGDNIGYGTAVVFEVDRTANISATALDANHVVFAYSDLGQSNFGKAIVGTVTAGDSLSFGNAVVYEAAGTGFISASALDSQRVVITYRDNGNFAYGTAVVSETVGTLCCLIGFETGDASEIAALGAGSSVQTTTVRSGSGVYSLQQAATQTTVVTGLPPEFSSVSARFSFRKPADPLARQTLLQFRNGATNLWSLGLTTAGELQVQQDEALGLTPTAGATPLTSGAWHTVRLAYDSAAGGLVRVWLDETLQINVTHTNAGSSITEIRLEGLANPDEFYYDDFWISDTYNPPPIGQIVRRDVDGVGNLTEFDTVSGSAQHFENVDEFTPNDDTDLNSQAASAPGTDLYSIANFATGGINAVKAMFRMKRGTGGNVSNTHHYAWRESGSNASEEFPSLGTSWATGELYWRTPPNSGGSWTTTKFDGLELGARHNTFSARDTSITWTTAMVDYDVLSSEVTLIAFGAVGHDAEVSLEWETASELDNLGFHLYRAESEDGPYERMTAAAIPGLGSSPVGARYGYRDTGLTNGVTYYYKLEDIETTGKTALHGPVSATPRAGASVDNTSRALITYGDPSASSIQVLERGRNRVVLELTTGGFYAEPQEDGTVELTIPEFVELAESDSPAMPVRRTWVEAIAGRQVKLVSVEARGSEVFTSLRPSGAAVRELEATREGTVRLRQNYGGRVGAARRLRTAARDELYPSQAARLVSVGFQGEAKKALVELAPLRWDEATGRLLLTKRLVVHVSFRGREPGERSTDGIRGRRYSKRPSHDERRVVARLATTERGLHGVRFEDVLRRGRGVAASELRLSRQGDAVAFHIEPHGHRFETGSVLYFVSEGPSANPYALEAVYELEVGRSGEQMAPLDSTPSGDAAPFYWARSEQEENRYYQAALVEAPDRWLWDLLFAPVVKGYPFQTSALASTTEPSRLSLWLQGTSDLPAIPDHHLRVSVNGSFVEDVTWDGKQARRIDVELPAGVVVEGENFLELENVGDTEAAYSMVMLDRFAVTYPRRGAAENFELEGRWSVSGVAEITGVGAGAHAVDVTDPKPHWLTGTERGADGALRFRAEASRSYLVVGADAVRRPEVRQAWASGLERTTNVADYLVVGPRLFLDAAKPLLELRRNQGLEVKAVAIEDVFADFGFGEPTPEAVKDLLSYAYHFWKRPPRYVVLLGDGTYDYKDYMSTGVSNQVPPRMVKTSYLWTASDPSYASVNGEDLLPDLAIGRLPAATLDEARTMVEKIVAYEMGEGSLRGPAVLIADNADRAGDFRGDAEELASGLLAGRDVRKIYLSELGVVGARDAILQSFDEGASLMSYLGHGAIHLWADENLLNIQQVGSFAPQSQQPLLLTMNCLNGYYHFPFFNSLSEELVKAEGRGAIAAFSPSGLSLNTPAHLYHQALLKELLEGSHERLGDAVLAAQEAYAGTGAFPELLSIYHLLGDPALSLE